MHEDEDDIWLQRPALADRATRQAGGLSCQAIELDPGGTNPAECLFGATDATAKGRVVALLDPARIFGLPEILEASGLHHVSLFQHGTDDSTPILVQLLPEARLTRQLLDGRDRPTSLLHAKAGIYFRTSMGMTGLRRHLRRLMRVSDDQGQVYFFRFWEPWAAQCYFEQIKDMPQRALHWFHTVEGESLGDVLVPDPEAGRMMVFGASFGNAARPHVPFRLAAVEYQALQHARLRADLRQIVGLIRKTFPDVAEKLGHARLERDVTRSVRRMQDFGIRQRDNLLRLAAWDLHSEGRLEGRDAQGLLRAILENSMPETQKMLALTERIAELDQTASPGRLA
ncbi:DUF4123 domain-containing protein [Paracoccus siganidrum]|nr:DUF4123 domain-containing protein [Paracoccus siganidrum]